MTENQTDTDYQDLIRRRRIAASAILALAFVVFMTLNDGVLAPFGGVFDDDSGTYAAGDPYGDWIYAECDGEQQQITVLSNGRLHGVAALETVTSVSLPEWCDLPLTDNQQLNLWSAKLERLNQLTSDSSATATMVLDASLDLPLSTLYLQPLGTWLDQDPVHGMEFLDAVAQRTDIQLNLNSGQEAAHRENFSTVLNQALRQANTLDPDPERVGLWLESEIIKTDQRLLETLARTQPSGPAVAASLIGVIDNLPRTQRYDSYRQLGEQLVNAADYAPLLVAQLQELPESRRVEAARSLLEVPGANIEFSRQLLSRFGDVFEGQRNELDAFILLADALQSQPGIETLLTGALDDLSDQERRMAAIHLVDIDHGDGRFSLAVLDALDSLHELSQSRVVNAILQSPVFANQEVQRRLVSTIARQFEGEERSAILEELVNHSGVLPETVTAVENIEY